MAWFHKLYYSFGGTNGKQVFNDLWSFDFKKSVWAKIDPNGSLPVAREGCSSAVVDDIIYIFGGRGEDGVQLNDLCAYKIKSKKRCHTMCCSQIS